MSIEYHHSSADWVANCGKYLSFADYQLATDKGINWSADLDALEITSSSEGCECSLLMVNIADALTFFTQYCIFANLKLSGDF